MHDIVMNDLEKHFSGDAPDSFYEHLAGCPACQAELAGFDEVASLFEALKADAAAVPEPSLGFCNRVVINIVGGNRPVAMWGLFSPGAVFFRRVAFASLLILASLGSFLVTHESSDAGTDAAAIIAQQQDAQQQDFASRPANRDRILVTLASFSETDPAR